MPTAQINGKEVSVPPGTPIIRAAALVGFNIPHFCYHPALSAPANCRMCLVELEGRPKLEPACYLKVEDGMKIQTESARVIAARKAVLEFILINHPVDCPICDQAGECKLQDYYMAYDAQPSRLQTAKVAKAKVYPIGPEVVYDGERCILCTRCVRFCDQITGTSELTVVERGDHSEIRTFPGRELDNAYSMNVTDICPVGALTTRDFRFKCRVWLLTSTDSVCTGCAKGCSIHLEHFQGEVQRYRPRFNPEVNEYWMCDAGRLSYRELHTNRLTTLRVGDDATLSWPRAARKVATDLKARATDGSRTAFVASAQASTETLFAAHAWATQVLGAEQLYWAGRPDGGSDSFLVSADKNPNRAGVVATFGEAIATRDVSQLLAALEAGSIDTLVFMGSELGLPAEQQALLVELAGNLRHLVVVTSHRSELSDRAHVVLPLATHAEDDGTFINEDGIVQPFQCAYAPRGESLPGWQIFARLARGAGSELTASTLDAIQSALFADSAAE